MMGHRGKMISGVEFDVLTRARRYYAFTDRPGVCKSVKRQFNKRLRRKAKECLQRSV